MAITGPKPKPTAIKILEGNPGKRPLNLNEPKPQRIAPECPVYLFILFLIFSKSINISCEN